MDPEAMVRLLRRVRHDYGNHFQVISGYIQLNMPEKALQYIQRITEEMQGERSVFESFPPAAALYFYTQLLSARDLGILLRYEDLEFTRWEPLQAAGQPVASLEGLTLKNQDEETEVFLSIYENEAGWDLCFSSDALQDGTHLVHIGRE